MGPHPEPEIDRTGPAAALERRLRQQSAVASLGQRALGPGEFDELLWFAVSLVRDVLEIDHVAVLGIEPDGATFTIRAGLGFPELVDLRMPMAGTQAEWAIRTGEPLLVTDLSSDRRFPGSTRLVELGLRSSLTVRIDDADGPYGALAVQSATPDRFTPDDTAFLKAMGAMLGQARRRAVAEERLSYLGQLVAATTDPIIATDLGGRITVWNAAAEARYGWTAAEAVGRTPSELIYDDGRPPHLLAGRAQLEAEGSATFTVEQRRKDGTKLTVEINAHAVTDRTGARVGYVSANRDITRRHELERRLLEAEKLDAVGRLAGGIAHDFNNVLTAIRGYAFVSGRKADDADAVRGYADKIVEAADSASRVVRQLLAFSRRQPMQPRRVEIDAQLDATSAMLRKLVGEAVDLRVEPGFGGAVTIDPVLFDQAILNLVTNAREAMPTGGVLTIRTGRETLSDLPGGEHCTILVTDTGPGIAAEAVDRVFEPFFSTRPEGSGLGLATVHGIVTQSGGTVAAGATEGGGAAISIHLPVAADEPETAAATGVKARDGTERVLVVEDETIVRDLTSLVLRDCGYDVVAAADGDEALAVDGPIDLVVSDVVLPRMSGKEIVSRLRQRRPGIRAIFISGYAEGTIVDHGILEPGVEFLAKPFSPDQLTALVRAVLDRP